MSDIDHNRIKLESALKVAGYPTNGIMFKALADLIAERDAYKTALKKHIAEHVELISLLETAKDANL